jgi:hypothetical protein
MGAVMSGNTPKILIIVVVVLVILFIVGLGVGAHDGLGISIDSLKNSLTDLFGSGPPLNLDDISSALPESCLNRAQGRIVIQTSLGTCTLTVGSSSSPLGSTRTLMLHLTQGTSFHYRLTSTLTVAQSQQKEMKIEKDLSGSDKVQFFQDGGTLILSACQNSGQSTCVITLN